MLDLFGFETSKYRSMLVGSDHPLASPTFITTHTRHTFASTDNVPEFFALPIPGDGETLHVITNALIDLTTALVWISRTYEIQEATITAWSYGLQDVLAFRRLTESGRLHTLRVIASDMHPKKHHNDHLLLLKLRRDRLLSTYAVMPLHAKVLLILTADGRRIVIESTANATLYTAVEQFTVSSDAALYDFYHSQFSDVTPFIVPASEEEELTNFDFENYEKDAEENHTVLPGD